MQKPALPCHLCPVLSQVVDLKLFEPGRELPKGLLWVVEQMPGLVVASDHTDTLEWGYWCAGCTQCGRLTCLLATCAKQALITLCWCPVSQSLLCMDSAA